MTETDYTEMLPIKPPQGIFDMAERYWKDTNVIVMNVEWITDPLTGLKHREVHCRCTACNEDFYCDYTSSGYCSHSSAQYGFFNYRTNEHIGSYNDTICPECGAPVKAIAISSMYGDSYQLACKTYVAVQKIESKLCIIAWWIEKRVDKKGKIAINSQIKEAYIFDGKRAVKCAGAQRYFWSYSYFSKWEQRKRYDDTLCEVDSDFIMPFDEETLIGTDCENSKLDVFCKGEKRMIVSYLRLWQKHPNIENLVMQGHSDLVNEALTDARKSNAGFSYQNWRGNTNTDAFDFKKVKPHEMLRLKKEEYKNITASGLSLKEIYLLDKYRSYDRKVTPDSVRRIKERLKFSFDEFTATGEPLVFACDYLDKQEKKYPDYKTRLDIKTLLDYWELCQKRSIDLTDIKVRYPQNLIAKHDQIVALIKFEASKELMEKYKTRTKKLNAFCFEDEETGLLIVPARSEKELIKEGNVLNHCVATYAKRHAEGETAIFFIRHTDNPTEPFFTLELDEKQYKVRQNRGKCNCARTPEVEAFERKWLAWLKENNIGKEAKKNGKRNRKQPAAAVA